MNDILPYLPAVNATFNMVAFFLLLRGWRQVRRGAVEKHKKTMKFALAASSCFLISYLTYHTFGVEKKFTGEGLIRTIYFFILITHVPLAALMTVPIAFLVHAGLTERIERHRKLARVVLPVWIYVSITGVLIYVLLHVLYAG